jgi:hypothetical protein
VSIHIPAASFFKGTDFLKENTEFTKIEEEIILPNSKQDGFYICKMRKEVTNE